MTDLMQSFRNFNKYRKTQRFKNQALRYSIGAALIFTFGQIIFFQTPIPDFGSKSREVDEGES